MDGGRAGEPRVVVIGGGFGGLNAAKGLGRERVAVTVVDRQNYHLFQPLLYQVATAALWGGAIATPIRWILRRQSNTRVILGDVSSIDRATRSVRLTDGARIDYDYLVVAPGAQTAYFGHEDWAATASGLKGLADAYAIRNRILLAFESAERASDLHERSKLLTFVVIGGGPTGVELAGALADIARRYLVRDFRTIDPRQARIVLVEGGPRILPTFPERLARAAAASLRRLGVEVLTHALVENVHAGGVELELQDDGKAPGATPENLAAATILWAAGVRPSPLGRDLGIPLDRVGRVPVQADLTLPGDPKVFVIGDLALAIQDGQPLPGLAAVAQQQGRYVAAIIAGDLHGLPRKPFRYNDKGNLATIGRAAAIAEFAKARIQLTGLLAWLAWLLVHLLLLIGFRNRLLVLIQWAWAYAF
ncbi:MAG: NAD(P)/FAD-dependent oxidoreductase, partial [Cyanobacteria bacterium REEB65]|nr:NAD(P)/FAD-dependent oxidoreductase [Cyanobacteria bacterium REEB65]